MERPYLVLWFAIAMFVVLGAWGIYYLTTDYSPPPAPATQPLVDRLKAERERRLTDRQTTAPTTSD